MRKVIGIAITCAVVALCTSGAWAADADAGKAVYTAKCKACHGADGAGNPVMAKTLKAEMKPLSASTADVKTVITTGQGKMHAITSVTGADLDNVVAYVKTFKK